MESETKRIVSKGIGIFLIICGVIISLYMFPDLGTPVDPNSSFNISEIARQGLVFSVILIGLGLFTLLDKTS